MNIILLGLILSIQVGWTIDTVNGDHCEVNSEGQLQSTLRIPNCTNRTSIIGATEGNFEALCETCKTEYDHAVARFPGADPAISRLSLKNVMTDEFKKAISANLFDVAALRSVYTSGADLSSAISKCDFNRFESDLKKSKCAQQIDFNGIKNQLAQELKELLSSTPSQNDHGILNRDLPAVSCQISDVQILRAKAIVLENNINDGVISKIKNAKASNRQEWEEFFKNELGALYGDTFSTHPIFSHLLAEPGKFKDFFNRLPSPVTAKVFRNLLYNDPAVNETVSKSIGNKCEVAFDTFKENICHSDIQNNQAKISSLPIPNPLTGEIQVSRGQFVDLTNPEQILKSKEATRICDVIKPRGGLDFFQKINDMTGWMPEQYATIPYESYRKIKYEQEVNEMRIAACDVEKSGGSCNESDLACQVFKNIKDSRDDSTDIGGLAKSSDPKVNELLRAMIGNSPTLPPATRTFLVNAGILPDAEGKIIPQPEVPQRRSDFLAREAGNSPTTPKPQSQHARVAPQAAGNLAGGASHQSNAFQPSKTALSDETSLPDKLSPTDQQELSRIENEMIRRLGGNIPRTQGQARQEVRDTFKDQRLPLPRSWESPIAHNLINGKPPFSNLPEIAPEERSTLSPGKSSEEQWRDEQRLRALSGMAGAQGAGSSATEGSRSPASSQVPESTTTSVLSTIALSVPDERLKGNLHEVLSEKLNRNDAEAQVLRVLLHNKKDFLLQLNELTFKISFDQKRNIFKVEMENGNVANQTQLISQITTFLNRTSRITAAK
jgi:hypothetical protein